MTHGVASVVTAGVVALAFLFLVGFVVWRLTATVPTRTTRVLMAVAAVLTGLPAVVYALLNAQV
ncbi:hypothetical protein [Kibdelosporangium phytohabitans]|uniref:hypothetical protein n=1 Tax=Kibdelosporangium phytohabitans TaxID=860235 RepID=UPI0012FA933A|nr:hypothetical protein [Kibdelosporangium phytohabitans]MBE1463878.1 ABC-type dipeptide/oligopeptide/nickel transport system permease subunit [Kibdelosporangium phytohabitans]